MRIRVKQTDVDVGHGAGVTTGVTTGVTMDEARQVRELERKNRKLRRAGEIFKRATSFRGAEPGRQHQR